VRTAIREAEQRLDEARRQSQNTELSRTEWSNRIIEGWSKRDGGVGKAMKEMASKDPAKAALVAAAMENQEIYFSSPFKSDGRKISESVVSTAFRMVPENAIRVVQLGFGQANRSNIFYEFGMQTPKDTVFYLDPIYAASVRGATAGNIMYQDPNFTYASLDDTQTIATAGGSDGVTGSEYALGTGTVLVPVRPGTVKITLTPSGGVPVIVGVDDRNGNLVATPSNLTATLTGGTINYATGAVAGLKFSAAPAASTVVKIEYAFSGEDPSQYSQIQEVDIQLRAYPFELREFPVYVIVSNMTKLLLQGTVDIDAQEAIVRNSGGELGKALDFYAINLAMIYARANGSAVPFNFTGAVGEAEIDRAQSVTRYISQAGNQMYNALQRGGVSKIVGGPKAVEMLKLHARFSDAGAQSAVNIYKIGSLDGIDIFKAPSQLVPDNELLCVYKNPDVPEDVALAISTYIPLFASDAVTFKSMQTEQGLAWYGDMKCLQPKYLQRIVISGMP